MPAGLVYSYCELPPQNKVKCECVHNLIDVTVSVNGLILHATKLVEQAALYKCP